MLLASLREQVLQANKEIARRGLAPHTFGNASGIDRAEAVEIDPIVVHGGGKAITAAMRQENITARFVDGFRYTDEASMKIIDRVLAAQLPGIARELTGPAASRWWSSSPAAWTTPRSLRRTLW